jgi:tetratricopeptide (TPR) repeat protein
MKNTACDHCDNKAVPVNDTIKIDGEVFCIPCFESNFTGKKDLEGRLVEKEPDPTICSSCNKDFNDIELKKISRYPVCKECEIKIQNRTFPGWVKGFFAGIVGIVIFSIFWNWKYYQAYINVKKSNEYFIKGDYFTACNLMASASEKVPEVEDLKIISSYFKGIDLLTKDKSSEALIEFNKCKEKLPEDYNISPLISKAKIGSCFDNKDYDGFLSAAKENLESDTTSANSWASVASAYACIYAEKGKDTAKLQAYKYLEKAESIDSNSTEMKGYYNMIEYRIFTRQIIKREDFIKKFPTGWDKN